MIEQQQDRWLATISALQNYSPLHVLQQALHKLFVLTIFGSFLLIISRFPYLPTLWQQPLAAIVDPVILLLLKVSPFLVAFGLAYHWLYVTKDAAKALQAGLMAATSLALVIPASWYANERMMNGSSLVLGLIVATLISTSFLLIDKIQWRIALPAIFPSAVVRSFTSLLTIILPLILALSLRLMLSVPLVLDPFEQLLAMANQLAGWVLALLPTLIVLLIIQAVWFLGLHGHEAIYRVMDIFWIIASYRSLYLFATYQPLIHIVHKQFIEVFVVGVGSTGVLAASLLYWVMHGKSEQGQLGKVASASALFNVSEPWLFGVPIMGNKDFIFPWLASGPLLALVAYVSMHWGWVPYPIGVVMPWTLPLGVSGFLVTLSWRGAVLQFVQLLALMALWLPFLLQDYRKNHQKKRRTLR